MHIYSIFATALFLASAGAYGQVVGGNNNTGADYEGNIVNSFKDIAVSTSAGPGGSIVGGNYGVDKSTGSVNGDITNTFENVTGWAGVGGNYGYTSWGAGNASPGDVNGNVSNTLINVNLAEFYGGNSLSSVVSGNPDAGSVRGKITTTLVSGTISGDLRGSSYPAGSNIRDYGDGEIEINILGGEVKGEVMITGGTSRIDKGATVNVSGGTVNYIRGGSKSVVNGDVNLNISGGTVNYAYAGGKSGGVVNGNSNIKITGGEVKNLYGTGMSTDHNGNVDILLAGGKITNVYGSYGKNVGEVAITLDGNKTEFADNSRIVGYSVYKPNGEMTLNVGTSETAFEGALAAAISNFDSVKVAEKSNASFNGVVSDVVNFEIGANSAIAFGNNLSVERLVVDYTSTVDLGAGEIALKELSIANFDETCVLGESYELNLSQIFGDSTTVVESALKDGTLFYVVDASGTEWNVSYSDGQVVIGGNIPEPSTYAAILGALALAFAAYRRRK